PLPDRVADPEDDRSGSDRRQGGRSLRDQHHGPERGRPGRQYDPPSEAALADHCVFVTVQIHSPAGLTGLCEIASAMPGTRLLFGGFYKVRFSLNEAVGRSVMYARGGKMLGGNSAFAHIGTYEEIGEEIAIEVKTIRHNPDPNYRAMAGTDD